MVIRGGENVYPREIEEFLYRHPKIQDVQVIGVPDPRYGEEICAWIKLHDGQTRDAPRRSASSARARSPTTRSRATSSSCREFPMTITGKIQKFVMREQTIEKLGLKAEKTASVNANRVVAAGTATTRRREDRRSLGHSPQSEQGSHAVIFISPNGCPG